MTSGKPLRVFTAMLVHETNTFAPLPTTLRSFEQGLLFRRGSDDATRHVARRHSLCVAEALAHGDEAVVGLSASAEPAGPLARRDYEALRDELLEDLRAARPVDFVFLVLHGAMVAEGYPDCEGDLLARVREVVGCATPVGALLDLHGNVSPAMIASGAVLVACKEYPHTDFAQRAQELYAILRTSALQGTRPRTAWRKVPMMGIFGTTDGPMHDFVRRLEACERQPGVLSVSAMHGFPWSDTAHTSAAILVVHMQGDPVSAVAAQALAGELADEFFALRWQAAVRRLSIAEALEAALAVPAGGGPVVIADGSDNPGGGASCDSTFLLSALLERGIEGAALGMIWDPLAAAIASDAGVGARLPLRIGGKVGPMSGPPVDLVVEVLAVRHDASQRGLADPLRDPLGPAVAVRALGVDIVLNSIRQQVFSPDCFTELGIALHEKRLVVVKSTQHFRAGFAPLAAAMLYCDAPGTLNGRFASLPYRHLPRPMWPLDDVQGVAAH
jgi:microcystin degradation protein MlrC